MYLGRQHLLEARTARLQSDPQPWWSLLLSLMFERRERRRRGNGLRLTDGKPLGREGRATVKLLDPSKDKREAFLRMAQDWLDHGNDRYLPALENFDAYLARVHRFRDAARIPVGRVPGTEFWLDDDAGEIVACVRLRFWLTPSLEVEGGHIGYDVRPSSRARGFGTAALGLALREAQHRGLDRVRLTVDSDNLASIKIIERNGGVLSGEAISEKTGKPIKQYWVDLSRQ
jgi:predicted acetyltransferase